jgi:arylsulfatase A-like enzyme
MKNLFKICPVLILFAEVSAGGAVVQFGGDEAVVTNANWQAQIGADQVIDWIGNSSVGATASGTVGGTAGQSAGATLSSGTHAITLTSISIAGGSTTHSSGNPNVLGVGPVTANAKFDAGTPNEAWTFDFSTNVVVKQLIISALAVGETIQFTTAGGSPLSFTLADCAAVTFGATPANRFVYTFAGGGLEVPAGTDITLESTSGQWGLQGIVVEVAPQPPTYFVPRIVQFGGASTNISTPAWTAQIGADQIVQWNGVNSWGGSFGAQGNLNNAGTGETLVSQNSLLTLTSRTISSTDPSGTNTISSGTPNVLGIKGGDNAKFDLANSEAWSFDFDQDVILKNIIISAVDGPVDMPTVDVAGVTNFAMTTSDSQVSAVTWNPTTKRFVYTFAGDGLSVTAGTDITLSAQTGGQWGLQGVVVQYNEPAPEPSPIPDPLPPPAILPGLAPALDPLPNIVLFLADDMGIGDSSAYQDLTGNPDEKQIHTPNMERLAQRGTRFTETHTPGSTCTPTRIGLLSGSYPFRSPLKIKAANQTHTRGLMFPGRRHTMAHMLKRAGYRTYGYGKWHLGHQSDKYGSGLMSEGPLESGFDTYTGSDGNFGYPGAMIKDHQFMRFDANDNLVPYHDPSALPWLEGGGVWTGFKDPNLLKVQPAVFAALESDLSTHMSAHAAKPLFIYYASHGNHDPYVAAPSIAGQINSSNVTVSGTILNVPLDPGGDLDGDGIPDPDYADPDYVWSSGVVDKWWDPHFETNALGEVIYNGPTARARMVVENDIIVGELLDFLMETDDPRNPGHKMIDNTLFIFTSDNGADMKARYAVGKLPQDDGAGLVQLNGFKGTVREGGTRVPFIASLPGLIATNATSSAIFGLNDLYATIAEMIGHRLEEDEAVDSESLLAAWTNGLQGVVRSEDLIYQHWSFLLSRRGEFKLQSQDGDYTGNSEDRFADSNNLDFDDMVFSKLYNLSNDLNEATNLGNTALASDMLVKANQLGGQGYSRTGAAEPINGANFMGGDFFSDANWRGYGNIREYQVPYSPVPGFITTNATVTTNLVGMKLMLRYDVFDFTPPGTGTLVNTLFEVRGGTFNATSGPVELVDSQLHVAAGTADLGSAVLGMNSSTGTVISLGGTLYAGAISVGDAAGATAGAKTVRFEKGDGAIILSDGSPIRFGDDGDSGDDFINFTTGTRGRLVSVEGAAFFDGLWSTGHLRIDGQTGTVSFAESGFLLLDQGDGTKALILDSGQPIDSDGDGIDDIWEQQRMGRIDLLDETGDYDLDGLTDVTEYILDSDPQVVSPPFLLSGSYDGNLLEYIVSFDSLSSRTYVAEHKPDLLAAADWEVMDVLIGIDASTELAYPIVSSNGFYRIRVYAP